MNSNPIYLGLTGSFGSGCGTVRGVLKDFYQFKSFKLSDEVRSAARERGIESPNRYQLQIIGNELRKTKGNNYLAHKVAEKIQSDLHKNYVIHGFRNSAEVQEFRRFPNFFLVAVDASKLVRWERMKEDYSGNQAVFEEDDERDSDEGLSYGQQVLRCVEQADILFLNEEQLATPRVLWRDIQDRFDPYWGLISGTDMRRPTQHETKMTMASNLALQSSCIKRRVGAVLCNEKGFIVSAAYNEVPDGELSCLEEFAMCYRDHYRYKFKQQLLRKYSYCPSCREQLSLRDDLSCSTCEEKLGDLFPSDFKALDKCRAIHAEEAVLLQTPLSETQGGTLYTTTCPCMQCAKRIVHAKIQNVSYIDPYPEQESIELLEKGGVTTNKFEGVKAQVFYGLYHRQREILEKEVEKGKV